MGIQLCDILDYLHHLSPYPILYQDLKPEHIILCGNQLKLIDFGIASFFTDSGNHFQLYGTDGFAAPEALHGQPTAPSSDIYGLGKILEFLADAADSKCSNQLSHIIKCSTAAAPAKRYQTAGDMKSALLCAQHQPYRYSSHLIRNIAVLGSRPGAGSTHFAISLASTLSKSGIPAIYQPSDTSDTLSAIAQYRHTVKEREGIFYHGHFRGMPDYGDGIFVSVSEDDCIVMDYGTHPASIADLESADLIFFILSVADWDIQSSVSCGKQLSLLPQTIFICNHGNKKSARRCARMLDHRVYCFPNDADPYHVSAEKERLISTILHRKGGIKNFWL